MINPYPFALYLLTLTHGYFLPQNFTTCGFFLLTFLVWNETLKPTVIFCFIEFCLSLRNIISCLGFYHKTRWFSPLVAGLRKGAPKSLASHPDGSRGGPGSPGRQRWDRGFALEGTAKRKKSGRRRLEKSTLGGPGEVRRGETGFNVPTTWFFKVLLNHMRRRVTGVPVHVVSSRSRALRCEFKVSDGTGPARGRRSAQSQAPGPTGITGIRGKPW